MKVAVNEVDGCKVKVKVKVKVRVTVKVKVMVMVMVDVMSLYSRAARHLVAAQLQRQFERLCG
jgi:hypothetical protein